MAYNEHLADKLRQAFNERKVPFMEKEMMGGLCIMVDDKMCVGIIKDDLMARVGPDFYEKGLSKPNAREMDFTKRPMKGYLYVNAEGWDSDEELDLWLDQCLEFNKVAKSSKRK